MAGLSYLIELGTSLDLSMWRSAGGEQKLSLVLPVRAAVEIEGGARLQGWTFNPRLNLNIAEAALPGRRSDWDLNVQAVPMYGSQRFNRYFYGVDEEYAGVDRPTYHAPGGYA